jgi:hypothetical protein
LLKSDENGIHACALVLQHCAIRNGYDLSNLSTEDIKGLFYTYNSGKLRKADANMNQYANPTFAYYSVFASNMLY